ncbi:MAG TPA: Clp protease N-terminal domain-containing protein [Gemmatimonadaceae bacterium]|nr:Clp protease N-terminal domain-containing protein [Gemmatimonadaceae bacterium]
MNGFNFSMRVRSALAVAREEAVRLKYDYVGTEHILLGLVADPDSVASDMLRQQNVSVKDIRAQVERRATPEPDAAGGDHLPYSNRSKRVLEQAMSEARNLGDTYVDTGHLLLGLVREKRDLGASVLNDLGFSRDVARDALRELHAAGREDPGVAAHPATQDLPPAAAAAMLQRIATSQRYAPIFAAHKIDVEKLLADIRGVANT